MEAPRHKQTTQGHLEFRVEKKTPREPPQNIQVTTFHLSERTVLVQVGHPGGLAQDYLQQAEAKLNASRVKLKYIAEEVMILKEKAVLDARLKLSKAACEVEMNEKKIEVMRDVYTPNKEDSRSSRTRRSRTEEYIRNLPNQYTDNQYIVNPSHDDPDNPCPRYTVLRPEAVPFTPNRPSLHEDHGIIPSSVNPQNSNNVNINSAARQEPALSPPSVPDQMTEFTKFLVKKDLLMSRLTKYDDNLMLYVSLKLNFKGIMRELGTTATAT